MKHASMGSPLGIVRHETKSELYAHPEARIFELSMLPRSSGEHIQFRHDRTGAIGIYFRPLLEKIHCDFERADDYNVLPWDLHRDYIRICSRM